MTDKSVMFSNKKLPVLQCIAFDVFPDARKIFDKFDFTINMGAFSFAKGQWEFDKNFLKHVAQKVLVLTRKPTTRSSVCYVPINIVHEAILFPDEKL
ncbi:DNA primase/helicase [Salmonella phage 19]|nr:DNA primase/helicase [Salmonella phage 19]